MTNKSTKRRNTTAQIAQFGIFHLSLFVVVVVCIAREQLLFGRKTQMQRSSAKCFLIVPNPLFLCHSCSVGRSLALDDTDSHCTRWPTTEKKPHQMCRQISHKTYKQHKCVELYFLIEIDSINSINKRSAYVKRSCVFFSFVCLFQKHEVVE